MPRPSKPSLRDELLARMTADLDRLEQAHRASIEGATHEEARPENSKDTRALEQSYLARGQAMRVEEVRRAVTEVAVMSLTPAEPGKVSLGALVTAEEDGTVRLLFIAPHGGGSSLADGTVQVVTPTSPLGQALVGREAGDVCELSTGGRAREIELVEVV